MYDIYICCYVIVYDMHYRGVYIYIEVLELALPPLAADFISCGKYGKNKKCIKYFDDVVS